MKTIKSNIIEIVVVLGGLFTLAILFSTLTQKEIHTDVLWYMNMGFNNIADPHWFTRYTHVFIQKIFFLFTDNPFNALKAYWIFLIVFSSGLIYLLARTLSDKSNFITGGLAVMLFLSFHLHGENFGVAWADMTSMLIVLITLLIFLISVKNGHKKTWLILLGALFFVAFKTKETAWVVMFLILPLALDTENKIDFKLFIQRIKLLLIGVAFAVVMFMLLNFILLEDAFFDFRTENIKAYLSFWIVEADYHKESVDWYRSDVFQFFPLVFLLYLYKGTKLDNLETKFIWLFPVLLISFLTVGMVKNTYTIYPRFLYPAFAVTCIFASQSLDFKYPKSRKKQFRFWFWLASGLIAYQVVYILLIYYIESQNLDFGQFVTSALQPIVLTGLILCIVFIKKMTCQTVIIPLILVFAFIRPNLTENYRQAIWYPENRIMQNRFYPLEVFGKDIRLSNEMLVYISTNVPDQSGFLSTDIDTNRTIFDLHFLTTTQRKNFTVEPKVETIYNSLLEHKYTYLFLTTDDWELLTTLPENKKEILILCTVSQDSIKNLVFLDCQ